MNSVNKDQIMAALRYAGVSLGTVVTVMGTLGVVSPDTASAIASQLHLVADDLSKTIGDAWKLGLIAAPVVSIWLAKVGYNSASAKNQIAAVQKLDAAQVIVTDPKLAEGIPGVKVDPAPPTS